MSSKFTLTLGFFSVNALKTLSKTSWSCGEDDQ
jgi:hypothetical protein